MNYAVITGDVVDSSQIKGAQKNTLNQALKEAFSYIQQIADHSDSYSTFDIFRGDSFQGILPAATDALKAAILIRATLRKNQQADQKNNWDARIAIGLGTIDYLPPKVSEGDGPAYQNSGPVMDNLKGDHKSAIKTPWKSINDEFKASCALLDAVIAKWSPQQAEVITMLLQNKTPKEIGKQLDISQAAVHYRVKGASWFAIKALIKRYEALIDQQTTTTESTKL